MTIRQEFETLIFIAFILLSLGSPYCCFILTVAPTSALNPLWIVTVGAVKITFAPLLIVTSCSYGDGCGRRAFACSARCKCYSYKFYLVTGTLRTLFKDDALGNSRLKGQPIHSHPGQWHERPLHKFLQKRTRCISPRNAPHQYGSRPVQAGLSRD